MKCFLTCIASLSLLLLAAGQARADLIGVDLSKKWFQNPWFAVQPAIS
jgi:hypothetical protein